MPINQNVKFLGVTNASINLTERKSAKTNTATEYFSIADIVGSADPAVIVLDTFASRPIVGATETIYITKDSTVMYYWDEDVEDYVLLNDPDVVNPDAPEEGAIYYVRLATISALNACTYDNGTAGVGATLTGDADGILSETQFIGRIDNVVPVLGDVILVKNQAFALQNGIYEITTLGDGSTQFVLTRIDGYDQTAEVAPSTVSVAFGSNNGNRFFNQRTVAPVIGTNNLEFIASVVGSTVTPTTFADTATSAPLPACTYANGTTYATLPAFNASLSADAVGLLGTINGVAMTSNMIIIVKDQVNQAHNGTYRVSNAGGTNQRWRLIRVDYNSSFFYRSKEFVVSNINSTLFGDRYTVTSPLTMLNSAWGTTNIVFTKNVSSANIYTENGTLTGNRTVNGGGFSLTFTGQSAFNVASPLTLGDGSTSSVKLNNAESGKQFIIENNGAGFNQIRFTLGSAGGLSNIITSGAALGFGNNLRLDTDGQANIYVNNAGLGLGINGRTAFANDIFINNSGNTTIGGQSASGAKLSVVSPGITSSDTAFAVRNSLDNADFFKVLGDGKHILKGVVQIGNGTTSEITLDNVGSGKILTIGASSGSFNTITAVLGGVGDVSQLRTNGAAWTMNQALRLDTAGTFGLIYVNNGGNGLKFSGVNTGDPHFFIKNTGVWNAPVMPIGNAGRVAGDIYMDTAANALLNGDLILIQKQ